jgi:hypothetical protein
MPTGEQHGAILVVVAFVILRGHNLVVQGDCD